MLKHKDRYTKLIFSDEFKKFLFERNWSELQLNNDFRDEFSSELIKNYRLLYKSIKYEEAVHQIEKLKHNCEELYEEFTPFEILALAMDSLLIFEDNEIKVKYTNYFDWLGHTNKLSEDILVACFVSNNNFDIENMNYITNIRHDNKNIEKCLNKGLSENHMHYNASNGNKHFNYFGLVINESEDYTQKYTKIANFIKEKKKKNRIKFDNVENINYEFQYLIYLRKYIDVVLLTKNHLNKMKEQYYIKYDKYCGNGSLYQQNLKDKYEALCSFHTNDYSSIISHEFISPGDLLEFYNIEREFTLKVINEMKNSEDFEIKQICMQYLYLKNNFEKELLHRKNYLGFATFEEFENTKDVFYYENSTLVKRYKEAIYIANAAINIKNIEYRTTQKDVIKTFVYMKENSRYSKTAEIEVGNVIHYIKSPKYTKRNLVKKNDLSNTENLNERKNFNELIKDSIYISKYYDISNKSANDFHLLGIDTANVEIGCRPEVFAQLFRALSIGSKSPKKRLNLTYHVGEEFESLLTGMRAIDEVLEFYPMKYGDRLGHAIALGKNVEEYYNRIECVYSNLGILLDDLVWLYQQLLDYSYNDMVFIEFLSDKIYEYFRIINNYTYEVNRDDKERYKLFNSLHPKEYYASMQLRSDNPRMYSNTDILDETYANLFKQTKYPKSEIHNNYNINNINYKKYFESIIARKINKLYHYDEKYNDILNREEMFDFSKCNFIDALCFVQQKLREKVDKKGIGIEVNISSNYAISDIDFYKKHPLFVFTDSRLSNGKNDMLVSINTDDAGVFDTSLYKEYTIIAKTLESEGYGSSKIIEYLEHLIKMSNEQTWKNSY